MPSLLLPSLQRYLRDRPSPGRQMSRASAPEEQKGFGNVIPGFQKAELIESPMRSIDVGECAIAENKFSYFLDGIQRSWLLYHHNYVPIYYGYVAAVIRKRQEAVMSTQAYATKEALYLPFRYIDPAELTQLQASKLQLIDSEAEPSKDSSNQAPQDPDQPEDISPRETMQPMALRGFAVTAITTSRSKLEAKLSREWIKDKNKAPGWLVMDGSIMVSETDKISDARIAYPHAVGMIKSHNTQYFGFPEQEVVFNLKAGQRSSTFSPYRSQSVCSWYLRLRERNNEDMYFGLVRVEVALKHKNRVDEISRWIMTERRPLSLPDSRWDRMIYPIRDCEQYLRSQEPSSASFGWLG